MDRVILILFLYQQSSIKNVPASFSGRVTYKELQKTVDIRTNKYFTIIINLLLLITDTDGRGYGDFRVILHVQNNTMFTLVELLKVGTHFLNVRHWN